MLVSAIPSQIAMVATLLVAIAAKLVTIVAHLSRATIRPVVAQVASVASAIPIIGADVSSIAADVAPVPAQIASVGADVVAVAANLARTLQRRGSLRVRDRGNAGTNRQREAECDQFVAKHLEILQRSVGTRPLIAPFEEVDEAANGLLRECPT